LPTHLRHAGETALFRGRRSVEWSSRRWRRALHRDWTPPATWPTPRLEGLRRVDRAMGSSGTCHGRVCHPPVLKIRRAKTSCSPRRDGYPRSSRPPWVAPQTATARISVSGSMTFPSSLGSERSEKLPVSTSVSRIGRNKGEEAGPRPIRGRRIPFPSRWLYTFALGCPSRRRPAPDPDCPGVTGPPGRLPVESVSLCRGTVDAVQVLLEVLFRFVCLFL